MSDLEGRIQQLEDLAAIAQLRAWYCAFLDDHDWDALVALFTEDGEFHGMGMAKGRAELRAFFERVTEESFDAFWHFSSNETIELDGNRATGTTYLNQPSVIDGVAYVCAGRYRDDLVRQDGRWLFARRRVTFFYFAPLADGWAPGRVVPARAQQATEVRSTPTSVDADRRSR